MHRDIYASFLCLLLAVSAMYAQPLPRITDHTRNMEAHPGFIPFYWDAKKGKLFLEVAEFDQELLYVYSLPAGLGSNDIGLDRGQLGREQVVKFQRHGPKVLLIQPNYDYRAVSDNPDEQRSVEEAFAQSVLGGFEIVAEEGDKVLLDATHFFMRDAHGVIGRLQSRKQGSYSLDAQRSAFYLPRTKNFPKNTEIEALLTFAGSPQGSYVRSVTPSPESISLRQHHSLVKLPEKAYTPRAFDPRAGFFFISYQDYASPLSESLTKRFIARHRLEKKNPQAEMSEAVEPIVYYLDRGAPEYIREAMFEGARWWNQAFEAAGFYNAFQVKLLPAEADPMDLRYNVVQWVHRSTRGWSYGASVTDPRTGEILKGHVTLGSLRLRQDYLIAEGLLAPYEEGKAAPESMQQIALARLRQLVAHEIGHTLGLSHNFAASTNKRASVMDYPHPYLEVKDKGVLDWSEAYDTDIGEWDKIAIRYGYSHFPANTNQPEALTNILQEAHQNGLSFISDADARPLGSAHPQAHLWDNGEDAITELKRMMRVREVALANFSEKNIRMGAPYSDLEDVLVPVYLMHRYQIEAVAKVLGGLKYTYALRGDDQVVTEMIPPEKHQAALDALLSTLEPKFLAIPESVLALIPPPAFGHYRDREHFATYTGGPFDALAAAETAANMTIQALIQPERGERLHQFHARNKAILSFDQLIEKVLENIHGPTLQDGLQEAIRQRIQYLTAYRLMELVTDEDASPAVKASASRGLEKMKERVVKGISNPEEESHSRFLGREIDRFLDNPKSYELPELKEAPAGSPIGSSEFGCSW